MVNTPRRFISATAVSVAMCCAVMAIFSLQGCIPLLAIAYDQQKQREQKIERLVAQDTAKNDYDEANKEVVAAAKIREAEAAEIAKTQPRTGCLLMAESRHIECLERSALLSNSINPELRAKAIPNAACDSAFNSGRIVCESYPISKE